LIRGPTAQKVSSNRALDYPEPGREKGAKTSKGEKLGPSGNSGNRKTNG